MSPERQGSDWRFWAAVPVVGIVLCAGLIGFHRYTHLGRSLSVDGLAMVGTTLVAAAIGFLAIVYQVRSSSRQLREQMADQHQASAEELERQERAIARAIRYEIDNFYVMELDLVENNLANWHAGNDNLPTAAGLRTNISEIYKAVSPILGSLNARSVSAIVKFYSMVGSYEGLWRDYQYCLDMIWCPGKPPVVVDAFRKRAGEGLEAVRSLIPELKKLAENVSKSLTQDYGLDELVGRSDAETH